MNRQRTNFAPRGIDSALAQKMEAYKTLCDKTPRVKIGDVQNGWEVVETIKHNNGYIGAVYKKGNDVVLCNAGTDFSRWKDHAANLKMALDGPSDQMKTAKECLKNLKDDPRFAGCNIETTGHSEGGSEATYAGLMNDVKAYTINGYGLTDKTMKEIAAQKGTNPDTSLVTNFRDARDVISKLKENVGTTYIIPNKMNQFLARTPFGYLGAHRLENLGDFTEAVLIDDYKLLDRFFIDNIKDVQITSGDISSMPSDIFSLYEREIDKRLMNHQIIDENTARQMTLSGQLIFARGYQRHDGTNVRGYYRRLA